MADVVSLEFTDNGVQVTKEFQAEHFPIKMGRAPDAEIRIQEKKVSRHHASLHFNGRTLKVIDEVSRNGIKVNGEVVTEKKLVCGDIIELATGVEVKVLDLPQVKVLSNSSEFQARPLSKTTFHRRLRTFVPVTVILLAFVGIGTLLYFQSLPSDDPVPVGPDPLAQLHQFKIEISQKPELVHADLARAIKLKRTFEERSSKEGVELAENIIFTIRTRRSQQLFNAFAEFRTRHQDYLREKKFGQLHQLAEEITTYFENEGAVSKIQARRMNEKILAEVERAYTLYENRIRYVETPDYKEHCLEVLEVALARFEGSPYHEQILERRRKFQARLNEIEARNEKIRLELAEELKKAEKSPKRSGSRRKSFVRITLDNLLFTAAENKNFPNGPILVGKLRGLVIEAVVINDQLGLKIQTEQGPQSVLLEKLEVESKLRLAFEALYGDELKQAAQIGYLKGENLLSDRLLFKYLHETESLIQKRYSEINQLLTSVRGLDQIPEGGFHFTKNIGWESLSDQVERKIGDKLSESLAQMAISNNESSFDRHFKKSLSYIQAEELTSKAKTKFRNEAIQALQRYEGRIQEKLIKAIDNSPFKKLSLAYDELVKRRTLAVKVIYDASIYLPNDHPDYKKGDEVNGQARVDELVGKVRELWERPDFYKVPIKASLGKLLLRWRGVHENAYPALEYRAELPSNSLLKKLWLNLDVFVSQGQVTLQNFIPNEAQRQEFEYSRKVEKYNRELRDKDLNEDTRAHTVIINNYREMMGHRRLFLDIRLCRASMKHSEVQDAAGRIWHVGVNGNPTSRAKAEGFPSGVGENVAIGTPSPLEIWIKAWYRSSGHHRNALSSSYTCFGYGYSGRVGTQCFGNVDVPF